MNLHSMSVRRILALAACLCLATSCSKGAGDVVNDDDGEDPSHPPSDVATLAISAVTPTTVALRWNAPHGGDPSTTAFAYDMRYTASALTDATWPSASHAAGVPGPLPPGMQQSMLLTGLTSHTTYWIALKTRNAAGLWSHLSNVVVAVLPADLVVAFPDTALDRRIRELIGKPAGEIRSSDVASLTELEANDLAIENLSGMEACTGLRILHLANNRIADLAPLSGLIGLQMLGLPMNRISDLAPIASLSNLTQLSLGSNQIADVLALTALTKIEFLNLSGNQIVQVTPLGSLTQLVSLDLNANLLTGIESLEHFSKLQSVNLDNNQINDLTPLVRNAGIAEGDEVRVRFNPLPGPVIDTQIPALQARGVTVLW